MKAQTIIAEIDLDTSRRATEAHFASWLGLCPDNKITGGRVYRRASRHVENRAASAFRKGMEFCQQRYQPQQIQWVQKKASELGLVLTRSRLSSVKFLSRESGCSVVRPSAPSRSRLCNVAADY